MVFWIASGRLALGATLLLLAGCAAQQPAPAASPTTVTRGWQPPRMVADAGTGAIAAAWGAHIGLALDLDGAATLVWDAPDPSERYGVFAARRDGTGAWGAAVPLAVGIHSGGAGSAAYPNVSGGAQPVVVWHDHSAGSAGIWGTCWRDGRFAVASRLAAFTDSAYPQVAGGECRAPAVWGGGPPLYDVYSAELDPSRGWSQPRPLGRATVTRLGRFAGGTMIAWREGSAVEWRLAGRAGAVGNLGGLFFAIGDDPAGRAPEAVLAWDGGGESLVVARYTTAGAWSSEQVLGSLQTFRSGAVAQSAAGSVVCIASGLTSRVRCARGPSGQAVGPLEDVGGSTSSPLMFVDAAVDALGRPVVAFATLDAIYAARWDASSGWGPVQRLDRPASPEANYWEVRIRADGTGGLLAAWMETIDRTARTTIWSAAFVP